MNQVSELIYVTSPGMGHLAAAVEFAKLIVGRDDRLSVAVLVFKLPSQTDFSAYIDALVASPPSPRLEFIDLTRLEGYDSSLEADPGPFKALFVESQAPLVRRLVRSRTARPAGLVVDMFSTAMADVADELGVPAYVFYPSPASFLALSLHLQALGASPTELGSDPAAELAVPGLLSPVPTSSLPAVLLEDESRVRLLYKCTERLRRVKGIIVNTFAELETGPLQWLAYGELPPVYPVGPILNNRAISDADAATLDWLDEQPAESVLFLCFGSMGSFHAEQVREIALALDRSGTRFLWSLRRPPPGETVVTYASQGVYSNPGEVLPEGFLEATAGRGKIIGWAPQAAVLAHRAVGGFVTHCGWNSVLESLWWGVPAAAWPIHAEQHLIAFQMARELGLAEEIRLDYKSGFYHPGGGGDRTVVGSREIEAGIARLMARDSDVRRRVEEMSQKSRKAMMVGGSSYDSLDRFISDVFGPVP